MFYEVYGTPQKYKCYVLTSEDRENIKKLNDAGFEETIAESMVCERKFGNVYSAGASKMTPGCVNCPCCTLRKFGKQGYHLKYIINQYKF